MKVLLAYFSGDFRGTIYLARPPDALFLAGLEFEQMKA